MEEDPRHRTIEGFIEGLRILAKYSKDGLKEQVFLEAAYDQLFLHISTEEVPEDSADGLLLQSMGFVVDEECWSWVT